jgi:hypothetical protein
VCVLNNNIGTLKTVEEFCALYPEDADYARRETGRDYILSGFVPWNHACACAWGGPWDGDHVLATIRDYTNKPNYLLTEEYIQRYGVIDGPTVEKPIVLRLAGNDDCSYSAYFATVEQAESMLQNILTFPFWESVFDFGFVFTN